MVVPKTIREQYRQLWNDTQTSYFTTNFPIGVCIFSFTVHPLLTYIKETLLVSWSLVWEFYENCFLVEHTVIDLENGNKILNGMLNIIDNKYIIYLQFLYKCKVVFDHT